MTVADYLSRQIAASGRSQKEIAAAVGWPKPNMITMLKQGTTKVPIEKAPALARALDVDPAHFTRMVMREYMPEAWAAIEGTFGESLSENERSLVALYRDVCVGEEIALEDRAVREKLRDALTAGR